MLAAGAGLGTVAIARRASRIPSKEYMDRVGAMDDRYGTERVQRHIPMMNAAVEERAMRNAINPGGLTAGGISLLGLTNAFRDDTQGIV